MVSKNPNPAEGFYLDPNGMALPGLVPFATPAATAAVPSTASSSEDPSKKIRKPYTVTKSRESWTEPEHDKFLEALQLFDRDWKKIEAFVGSKTVIQVLFQSSSAQLEPGHFLSPDSSSMLMIPVASTATSSWTNNVQTVGLSHMKKGPGMGNNRSSSNESAPKTRAGGEMTDQGNHGHLRVLPDFVQVYSFIGGVFDPNVSGHLQKLKKMDPIDVETVLLLMRNLSINLTSPDFEDHRRLLSSYETETETANYGGANNNLVNDQQCKNVT